MPPALVECVPNFSEARRPQIVEAIIKAIQSVENVLLLDRHSDGDHNRTVLTFVGAPASVEEAAFRAIKRAAELINLDEHRGEHPRIGATDVVPFIPLSGVSMQECIGIANRLGKRVGEELGIPVYLYEEAARRPERQNLENIRRGQYEGLKEEIGLNPERGPDFGPARLGPAGATVIGARPFLIAYNVFLTTGEVEIAQKVARAVRHSSGGLRYVKGLGLLVEGRAQVSMNLTNFRGTPLARVVELVRREAARHGVSIHHSELVGLIPQEALVEAARWYLQLDTFEAEQVLEARLASAQANQAEIPHAFLDSLAAGTAAPGGGAAAAYSVASGAALVSMVARLTLGKKKYAQVEAQVLTILERSEALRAELTSAIEQDSAAFQAVMAALRLPKETPEQLIARQTALHKATLNASEVPLRVAKRAAEVIELAAQIAEVGNLNALSDAGTGAELALAGLRGAAYNVRTNLAGLEAREAASQMQSELSDAVASAEGGIVRVRASVARRANQAPA